MIRCKMDFNDMVERRNNKMENKQELIETVKDEADSYTDDSLYNITSFGTDMSYREIVAMYNDGDLEKPELQRKYVWTRNEASRFIDSILLGLPVPSIFLAKTTDDRRLIVDGYQRIMTVYDYMEKGVFSGDGKAFRLSNSENIHPSWRGKTFAELSADQKRKIRTSPIHAIVFEQKHPQNDTGMYQIFERINTSGRALKPQEIRNCVYHGRFNQFLMELNREKIWRDVIGSETEDSRMADVELILRFFAFSDILQREEMNQQQINLVKYLNEYMRDHSDISPEEEKEKRAEFINTITFLHNAIGEHVFRAGKYINDNIKWAKKVNPVIFDAVCTATVLCNHSDSDTSLYEKYCQLFQNGAFEIVTHQRTTNTENIRKRIEIAAKYLYGAEL